MVSACLFILGTIGGVVVAMKLFKQGIKREDSYGGEIFWFIGGGASAILSLIFIAGAVKNFYLYASQTYNPEYWAIQQILKAL